MSIHKRMRNMVIRQLGVGRGGNGVPITLQKKVLGVFDPKNGSMIPPTITEYNCTGIRVNYKESDYRDQAIVFGDFQLYISPVLDDKITDCPTPEVSDVLVFNSKKVKTVRVSPFNENDESCGWKLQVRYG